jgi:methenyltetrahydromethanopterin cyclohydrolase
MMVSINRTVQPIIEEMLATAEALEIRAHTLGNGATLIDCGVNVRGSYRAGALYVQACLAGLATAEIVVESIGGIPFPFLHLTIQHPVIACLGSQKAGWIIKTPSYRAMASGPARALSLQPKSTYRTIGYQDDADKGVIALEADTLPDADTAGYIAEKCGIDPSNLTLLVAPIQSLVGSMQISGRVVTIVMHSLEEAGYDLSLIRHAAGSSPIAPVKKDMMEAMGTTNDCNIYYGSVCITTERYDDLFETLPSQRSPDYGKPFFTLFRDAGNDFLGIDSRLAFSPAEITINDSTTGAVRHFGARNSEVLLTSFGVQ